MVLLKAESEVVKVVQNKEEEEEEDKEEERKRSLYKTLCECGV